MSEARQPAAAPGAFAPFGERAFALLWTATLISNIGTWMHDVGAGWLMTTLSPDPAIVTLVQAATTLPVFLFALLAGTLADRLDKRRMLIVINGLLTFVVAGLAVIVWAELVTPLILILFTLAIGTGTAFMAPAWQAIVPQLVPRPLLRQAIGLNSMGINISRAIGPALAGALIAGIGLAVPFLLNAASYVVILAALLLWRPEWTAERTPAGPILRDMMTGLRHVRHNMAMRATILRAAAFFIFASAYWALLPLIARDAEGGGAELYGILMGLIGAGAVTGALLLPRAGKAFSLDKTVHIGSLGTVCALATMAIANSWSALFMAAFLGGLSWIAVLTSLNVSAQTALPDWVRARGLAVNLMVFFGSMAFGSLLWGQVAALLSIPVSLALAAAGLVLGQVAMRRYRIGQSENADLTPAAIWPAPPMVPTDEARDRPAMVTVTYQIDPCDVEEFLKRASEMAKERLRDGATHWDLYENVEVPGTWIEIFHMPSWQEHLLQHERVAAADAAAQEQLRSLHKADDLPRVRHWLARL